MAQERKIIKKSLVKQVFSFQIAIDNISYLYYNIDGERKMKAPLKEYIKEAIAILWIPIPIMIFFKAWMWFLNNIPLRELEAMKVILMLMTMIPLGFSELPAIKFIENSRAKLCDRFYLKLREILRINKIAV